jgi:hypothetical protein
MFTLSLRPSRRRVVAALTALVFALATSGLPAYAAQPAGKGKPKVPEHMIPISITGVSVDPVTGGLVARGLVGDQPFTAPVDVTSSPNAADPDCPILNLMLGPIHLDLLGLVVDTSMICVSVTAHEGGGLLGDLLCGVAGLLDGGLNLGDILNQLTAAELSAFLDAVTALLDNVFDQLTAGTSVVGVSSSAAQAAARGEVVAQQAMACDILNLSLGPIDLNLLGLEVMVDNCDNGPVTLDITAEPGNGNLLGNLLCGLANLLNGNGSLNAIAAALNRIADAIGALL